MWQAACSCRLDAHGWPRLNLACGVSDDFVVVLGIMLSVLPRSDNFLAWDAPPLNAGNL